MLLLLLPLGLAWLSLRGEARLSPVEFAVVDVDVVSVAPTTVEGVLSDLGLEALAFASDVDLGASDMDPNIPSLPSSSNPEMTLPFRVMRPGNKVAAVEAAAILNNRPMR